MICGLTSRLLLVFYRNKMENERLSGKDTREDNVEGNVEAKPKKVLGLTTKVALDTLHRDVGRVLQEYEEDHRRNK